MEKNGAYAVGKLNVIDEERGIDDPSINEGLLSDWELTRSRPRHYLRRATLAFLLVLLGLSVFHATRRSSPPSATDLWPEIRPPVDPSGSLLGAKVQKAVVLASYAGQDTSWIDDVPEE